jgi:hypothetical protein
MAQEIFASIRVQLPEDAGESAERHAAIATAWSEFIRKIGGLNDLECSVTISEARAKRGPRKPRLVSVPDTAA